MANAFASPVKAVQIPLNDDAQEKATRLQNRQATHSRKMDELKAAVGTPKRKRKSLGRGVDPSTPSQDEDDLYASTRGEHVTPLKRVPILANFEEWMKMATDNKINAANSWNFALIDYFHDLSLLKEGDGVNFQKASCTLDGCVKIYTSRVDSVATETGKLLSGLAENVAKKRKGEGEEEDGEDGDDEEVGEDGVVKKKGRKKTQRSAESTLVNSFEQLRLKKMELEFSVDPLFKKASADFDEGGAKGLLLNHLSIDNTGRIVFDSSDDVEDEQNGEVRRDSMEPDDTPTNKDDVPAETDDRPIDIAGLQARFFPDLNALDEQDICPSLKTFELGNGDGSLDLPFLKAPENWRDDNPDPSKSAADIDQSGVNLNDDPAAFGMDDNDDDVAGLGGFDMPADIGFGEGGEAWARDAALIPQMRVYDTAAQADANQDGEMGEVGAFDANAPAYSVTLQHRPENDQENILNYFDSALAKNWAGPEHWKIARVKEANRPSAAPTRTKKEKEPFEIDFNAPMTGELASLLYTRAKDNTAISMPRKERRSATRHLLPDDKHFNSKDLLKLFLKPKARLGARMSQQQSSQVPVLQPHEDLDEAYWAKHGAAADDGHNQDAKGDYDADFFQDDGLPMLGALEEDDDMEFADARENFLPANADEIDAASGARQGDGENDGFAANLVAQSRRVRPEYVQYARVAKKVDVRRLKEEMWRGCGFDKVCTISIHLASLLSYRLLVAFSIGMQACPEERERI
jgi:condensin complex subunit 2